MGLEILEGTTPITLAATDAKATVVLRAGDAPIQAGLMHLREMRQLNALGCR